MSLNSSVLLSAAVSLAIVAASCGNQKEGTAPPEQRSQALTGPIFNETWEGGTDGWIDRSESPPVLVSDPDAPSNTVQEISRAASGGDYFSPLVAVTPSEVYCVSTRIKWVSGGAPFLAIQRFDNSANEIDLNWLIGASYTDPLGPVTEVNPSTTAWHRSDRTKVDPLGAELATQAAGMSPVCSGVRIPHLGHFERIEFVLLSRAERRDNLAR